MRTLLWSFFLSGIALLFPLFGEPEVAYFGSSAGTGYFERFLLLHAGESRNFHKGDAWMEPQEFNRFRAVVMFSVGGKETRAWNETDVEKVTEWVKTGGVLVLNGGTPYRLSGGKRNLGILEPLLGGLRYSNGGEIQVEQPDHPLLASLQGKEHLLVADSFGLGELREAVSLISSGPAAQFSLHSLGEGYVVYLAPELQRLSEESGQLYAELLYGVLGLAQLSEVAQQSGDSNEWGMEPLGPVLGTIVSEPPLIRNQAGGTLRKWGGEGRPLSLTEAGEPRAVVVLPDTLTPSARDAAELLRESVNAMTGVLLPLYRESELVLEQDAQGAWRALLNGEPTAAVLVGETGPASAYLADIPAEGYLLKSLPNELFLVVGRDVTPEGVRTRGTFFGMLGLLERHLGFRWLWPGELGEVIPTDSEAVLPVIHETNAPALLFRRVRISGANTSDRNRAGLKRLGVEEKIFAEQNRYSREWASKQRLGQSVNLGFGHAYGGWWDRYGKEHPEWFALQPNGSRIQYPPRERLCVSNYELAHAIAAERIERLRSNPAVKAVSISPNDGSARNNFCMCVGCRSYDSPQGELVNILFGYNGYRQREVYHSLSDRYLQFYNRIAEEVSWEHPDRWVGGYAYSAYRSPPLYTKAHPNLLIGFVGLGYFNERGRETDLNIWNGWARITRQIFLRPNAILGGHGFPSVYAKRLAEDIRHCFETGMMAADFSAITGHWAAQGLNYYLLPRLLWDPGADVEALIRDYCEKGFNEAADEIRVYFEMLEELTTMAAIAAGEPAGDQVEEDDVTLVSARGFLNVVSEFYTPEKLQDLGRQLDRAVVAAGENERVLKRIEFLRQGLVYADLQSQLYGLRGTNDSDAEKGRQILEERYQFFLDIFKNDFFAVGVTHITWQEGWVRRNPFGWRFPSDKP